MFERFTTEARQVVKDAEAEARRLGSSTIDAEHILIALTRQDATNPATAALHQLGLDYEAALEALESERRRSLAAVGVSAGDFELPRVAMPSRPRFAATAKTTLERALRASVARGDRRITAGHVLFGLLRAEAGTVPRALQEAGVDPEELRARTAEEMDRAP